VTPTGNGANSQIEWSGISTLVEICSAKAESILCGIFSEELKDLTAHFTRSKSAAIFHHKTHPNRRITHGKTNAT